MARKASITAVSLLLAASCGGAGSGPPVSASSTSDAGARSTGFSGAGVEDAGPSDADGTARRRAEEREREKAALAVLERAVTAAAQRAVAEGRVPGVVVAIGNGERTLYEGSWGRRAVEPATEPMTVDTVFDLASLTKPIATATSLLVLAERDLVDLDLPIARYVPEFAALGKSAVTSRDLLTHTSGLVADDPMSDYRGGAAAAMPKILASKLIAKTGTRFIYSDVGYLALGELVLRASGTDLATFSKRAIFEPLGMTETTFSPKADLVPRIAPTERVDGKVLRGEVHDPRARALGGVAGHAGLFSTARDVSIFARALLGRGSVNGHSVLLPSSVRALLALHDVPNGLRTLGWDVATAYTKTKPKGASPRAFGHTGYTGTSLWIDPELDLSVVVLTNRVHPDGKGQSQDLAAEIGAHAAVFAKARLGREEPARSPTRPGIDALAEDEFHELAGARVGLVTNDAARTRSGERTIDRLVRAPGVTLVRLFSPEHGLGADREGAIDDAKDAATGLPVTSLFGKDHAPTRSALLDLDVLVVDLVDVGARFFTYASTLHDAMRAGAKAGVRVVVLDRPNPLGGTRTSGPLLAKGTRRTFVNHAALPIEHGMTLGELAELFLGVDHLPLELTVIPVRGWQRGMRWEDTGLAWVPPSPNLRTIDETRLYPGVALVEGANVSVGRGTDAPFELVGAPWIDAAKLTAALVAEGVPGVGFEAADFTPNEAPYSGALCHGVRITLRDLRVYAPLPLGFALLRALATAYPSRFQIDRALGMVGDGSVLAALKRGERTEDVERLYAKDLAEFDAKRAKYILYR